MSVNYGNISNLSQSYKQLLGEFTPTLQENFKDRFQNEMERTERRKEFIQTVHPLDPITVNDGDVKIVCTDLKLPWIPVFLPSKFELDLPNLSIAVQFSPFDLQVVGNCFDNNLAHPASDIKINVSDVTIEGNIGLVIISDSFVPEFLDVKCNYGDLKVPKMEFATSSGDLAEKIWPQVKRIVLSKLHDHLYPIIIDFSVMESLADEEAELRSYGENRGKLASEVLGGLLKNANEYLNDKSKQSISTPSLEVSCRGQNNMDNCVFRFSSGEFKEFSDLATASGPMIYEVDERVVILATLNIQKFKHTFEDIVIEFNNNHLNDRTTIQVYKSNIFMKLSFEKSDQQLSTLKLEEMEVRKISDIEIDSSPLDSVEFADSLRPIRDYWVTGYLRSGMEQIILNILTEAFGAALEKRQTQNVN
ncbi:uncharacterized protein LOC143197599 isoform X2 [Rhynchophorus ferrugineus]|uniref:uncharacterized protein LOC143197599 isoform X2 n=1 Tax=Rhynchophorus ferrugineus TaxID=354439 RepID=UPI003FCC2DB2